MLTMSLSGVKMEYDVINLEKRPYAHWRKGNTFYG